MSRVALVGEVMLKRRVTALYQGAADSSLLRGSSLLFSMLADMKYSLFC